MLISVNRRRARKTEFEVQLRNFSYTFKVRINETEVEEMEVCQKAFISLHGITNRRLIILKKYIYKKMKVVRT